MKPIWRCGLLAYMEAIVRPQAWDHRDKMGMRPFPQALRFEKGEAMVLQDKPFLERILPVRRARRGRRPTLTGSREISIEGEPGVRLHGRRSTDSQTQPTSFWMCGSSQ
jgi:hypothetical protein